MDQALIRYTINNMEHGGTSFETKNYILFAFKLLSLKDVSGQPLWDNELPNSPFGVRPISLICKKENEENVKFILDTIINPKFCNYKHRLDTGKVKKTLRLGCTS